jgi:hypothetical protein
MSNRFQEKLAATRHPDFIFWGCFLILNGLLFFPLYVLNRETTSFLPLSAQTTKQWILWRNNLDMFRLNAEIPLLIALWIFIPWLRAPRKDRWFRWLFLVIYVAMLSYYVYESIMLSMYQADPVFYSHYRLAVDGLQMVIQQLDVPVAIYAVVGGGLAAAIIVISGVARIMLGGISVERLSRWSRIGIALLTLLICIYLFTQQTALASPKMVVSSFGYKLQKNVQQSINEYQKIANFDDSSVQSTYDYADYDLLRKPNIYLIFVESYGSVLYKRPDYKESYTALLADLQQQYQNAGWHTASTLSESPTWGGGSWMAYTSALFGLRVDSHPQYLSLFEKYQSNTYPDLGHFLQNQGYEYVQISSLSKELSDTEQQQYINFYQMDRWLRYSDLEYNGPNYGWGPAPPDQYVLNFAHETVVETTAKPTFLFFITQNSHFPWVPLPKLLDDWRGFTLIGEEPEIPSLTPPHDVKRQNYFNAINYELRFLTDHILQTGDDESLFILIGDHQPQQVSRRSDSFDTPIHIISKDAALIDAFSEFGFLRGLSTQIVGEPTATMRHEGLYSMLVRVLVEQYGQGNKVPPPYLPEGIPLKQDFDLQEHFNPE